MQINEVLEVFPEISVEDMLKIVDANEKLVKEFKNNGHSKF